MTKIRQKDKRLRHSERRKTVAYETAQRDAWVRIMNPNYTRRDAWVRIMNPNYTRLYSPAIGSNINLNKEIYIHSILKKPYQLSHTVSQVLVLQSGTNYMFCN